MHARTYLIHMDPPFGPVLSWPGRVGLASIFSPVSVHLEVESLLPDSNSGISYFRGSDDVFFSGRRQPS